MLSKIIAEKGIVIDISSDKIYASAVHIKYYNIQ